MQELLNKINEYKQELYDPTFEFAKTVAMMEMGESGEIKNTIYIDRVMKSLDRRKRQLKEFKTYNDTNTSLLFKNKQTFYEYFSMIFNLTYRELWNRGPQTRHILVQAPTKLEQKAKWIAKLENDNIFHEMEDGKVLFIIKRIERL